MSNGAYCICSSSLQPARGSLSAELAVRSDPSLSLSTSLGSRSGTSFSIRFIIISSSSSKISLPEPHGLQGWLPGWRCHGEGHEAANADSSFPHPCALAAVSSEGHPPLTRLLLFQVVLINAIKDVAKALSDLIGATKGAASKPADDPSMYQLKGAAKVEWVSAGAEDEGRKARLLGRRTSELLPCVKEGTIFYAIWSGTGRVRNCTSDSVLSAYLPCR